MQSNKTRKGLGRNTISFPSSIIMRHYLIYESGRGFSKKTPDLKPEYYFFLVFAGLLVLVLVAAFFAAGFLVATFLTSFPWS